MLGTVFPFGPFSAILSHFRLSCVVYFTHPSPAHRTSSLLGVAGHLVDDSPPLSGDVGTRPVGWLKVAKNGHNT